MKFTNFSNVKLIVIDPNVLISEVGKYGKWVPGRAEKVGDNWSPGNKRMRLIEAVQKRRGDNHFSK